MCRCEFCDLLSILWMNIDHVYLYLFLSIQLSIYIRFLPIYLSITISPPIYISTYLSVFVFFSLRVSNYQDKNKLKMYTAMCWVVEGPHRFMKLFVALSIFFIAFWGYNEKLTAILRDWVKVHMKTAHKFLCQFEQDKRENMTSCEKGAELSWDKLWAQ